jgi:hypothetical protein
MPVQNPLRKPTGTAAVMAGRMIVARYIDGKTLKGTTQDFLPNNATFHLYEGGDEGSAALTISIDELKAVFFVKSFEGQKDRVDEYDFEKTKGYGRKCAVMFPDGEIIAGYTSGYSKDRPGFFMIPAEADSNNARIFIVNRAVKSLRWV